MSALAIPVTPDNLRMSRKIPVSSDVFNICDRVKEVSPRLLIYGYDPPVQFNGTTYHYAIQEMCDDRVERFVCRVEVLDARIIEHLEYLLRVPFEHRYAEAEKLEDKANAEAKEHELDELYETMGAPMRRQLEHDGFTGVRNRSYAKRGVKAR